jgi:hypothetical protein
MAGGYRAGAGKHFFSQVEHLVLGAFVLAEFAQSPTGLESIFDCARGYGGKNSQD